MAASAVLHLAGGLGVGLASTPFANSAPAAIQVSLVASLPAPRPKPAAKALPARRSPPPKKAVVLPKQSTTRVAKRQPAKTREIDYEDALSQLRDELGESEDAKAIEDTPDVLAGIRGSQGGRPVDREVAAWMIATRRHVRSVWVTPPEFLERTLRTEMWIEVAADGTIVDEPQVVESSGDPFWDDNAVRAMLSASPLPAPPSSGRWRVAFPTRGDE